MCSSYGGLEIFSKVTESSVQVFEHLSVEMLQQPKSSVWVRPESNNTTEHRGAPELNWPWPLMTSLRRKWRSAFSYLIKMLYYLSSDGWCITWLRLHSKLQQKRLTVLNSLEDISGKLENMSLTLVPVLVVQVFKIKEY